MFCWCTFCSVGTPSALLVHLRQVHPLKAPPKSYLREPKPPLLDEPDGLNVERGDDEPDELSRREPKLLPEKPLLLSG